MAEFWAGGISALIGALVGGVFTALVARMQLRAASAAAVAQLRAEYDRERKLMRAAAANEAIDGLARALAEADQALLAARRGHRMMGADGEYHFTGMPEVDSHALDAAHQRAEVAFRLCRPHLSEELRERVARDIPPAKEPLLELCSEAASGDGCCAFDEYAEGAKGRTDATAAALQRHVESLL